MTDENKSATETKAPKKVLRKYAINSHGGFTVEAENAQEAGKLAEKHIKSLKKTK